MFPPVFNSAYTNSPYVIRVEQEDNQNENHPEEIWNF